MRLALPAALAFFVCALTAADPPAPAQPQPQAVSIDEIINVWKQIEQRVIEAAKDLNLIGYEKEVLQKYLVEVREMNEFVIQTQVSNQSPEDKARAIAQRSSFKYPLIMIREEELSRARQIRDASFNATALNDALLFRSAGRLPDLSRQIYKSSLEAHQNKLEFRELADTINAKFRQELNGIQRTAQAERIVDELKKLHPDIYNKIASTTPAVPKP